MKYISSKLCNVNLQNPTKTELNNQQNYVKFYAGDNVITQIAENNSFFKIATLEDTLLNTIEFNVVKVLTSALNNFIKKSKTNQKATTKHLKTLRIKKSAMMFYYIAGLPQ